MKDRSLMTPIRPVPTHLPVGSEYSPLPMQDFEAEEVPLREYWRVTLKYRTLIGATTVLFAAICLLYAFTATPRYTASARIRISTYEPVLAATQVESVLHEKSKEANYLETQIQEIRSHSLADMVLRDEKIKRAVETEYSKGFWERLFGKKRSAYPEDLQAISGYEHSVEEIRDYLDTVSVNPIKRTSLVVLSARLRDPAMAAYVANKHALAYIEWVRENWVEQQSHSLQFLRAQAGELRARVTSLEREMAEYAEEHSIVAVNKDENITAQRMAQLNKLLTDSTAKKIELEHAFREASEAFQKGSAALDDLSVHEMRAKLAQLEAEQRELSAKFTPRYPKMQQLAAQIEGLRQAIDDQRQQLIEGLHTKMLAAAEEEKRLREELERQKSVAFDLSRRQVQYNVLAREMESSRELLQNVLRQIEETALAVEGKSSNVSVVDYAVIPDRPTSPNKSLTILCGLAFGLCSGLALAFLLNYLDNTIRTPEDAAFHLKLPALGVVPSFELDEGRRRERDVIEPGTASDSLPPAPLESRQPVRFVSDPQSLSAEAYRAIRTAILLSQAGEPPRTLLVTSAQSSEGKTTSSLNLAASLAGAGGRVALIDADLRRPSLAKYLGLPPGLPGVVEVITGQMDLRSVAVPDVIKRITLFPTGKIPPNPAELLGSLEMAAIVDQLAANFDYVLIDSPPVLPVTDSVILSRIVDGVVLVVKGGATPRKVTKDARDRLNQVGARILGTILNDVNVRGGDYYYYHRYYHSYHEQEPGKESGACAAN